MDITIQVRLFSGPLLLGSPAEAVVPDHVDHEELQEVIGRLCHQKIDDARLRGMNMCERGMSLRITFTK